MHVCPVYNGLKLSDFPSNYQGNSCKTYKQLAKGVTKFYLVEKETFQN